MKLKSKVNFFRKEKCYGRIINRLIDEAFDEIENDNMAFLAEQDAKADGFNLKYRKNLLDTGLAAAGKVLK